MSLPNSFLACLHRIFDFRCSGEVNSLGNDKVVCGVTSVQFSKSGHFLFGGYEDGICRVWDVTKGIRESFIFDFDVEI
jgi:guanine nucleotide-binding protein G(I)/G(S)/G(T) subunit beta-1